MKIPIKNMLYHEPLQKIFLDTFVKRKISNKIVGKIADNPISKIFIKNFEKDFGIDRSLFKLPPKGRFRTLNDFFTRDYLDKIIKKAYPSNPHGAFHSPVECFLSLQTNINPESIVQAKGFTYSLSEFIGSNPGHNFSGGTLIKLRLTPKEYHHAHYFDNGKIVDFKDVKGSYYTSDFASVKKIKKMYCKSHRHVMKVETKNFGTVYYVEVGATFVGTIIQNNKIGDIVKYGDKKSLFKFGGSTVFLLFEKNKISLRDDIKELSINGEEKYVTLGEVLGKKM